MAPNSREDTQAAPEAPLDTEKAKADLLKLTAPMRRQLLSNLREKIKGCVLADPDMWPCVRSGANAALDRMWADVEHEVERSLHCSLLQQQADADVAGPSGGVLCSVWWRFRAFVLHHYLPHNRYFFGKLKDPVYLMLYVTTLIPVHGVRVAVFAVVFLMIAFPGPPDEFQLINYILLFKGMQFLTSGLIAMGLGAMKYFACYSLHKEVLLQCIEQNGPGASDALGQLTDYLGSIALVWIAFLLLPSSKRVAAARGDECRAGGRLRHLLHYDVKCFALSLLLLLLLSLATCSDSSLTGLLEHPQFCANVFWCCTLYSLLSLPFASFAIPGWQTVLTHSDATGFNRHGACVAFGLSAAEPEGESESFARLATIATSVLSVMERGREARGGEAYQVGDLGRGLWHSLFSRTPVPEPQAESWSAQPEPSLGLAHDVALAVASVRLPAEAVEQWDGVTYYCVEIHAEGSLDGDAGAEPWRVMHRYRDFYELACCLGASYAEAPFPPKYVTACSDEMLKERRLGLEHWLQRVLQDPTSQGSWARALHEFLEAGAVREEPHLVEPYMVEPYCEDVLNVDPPRGPWGNAASSSEAPEADPWQESAAAKFAADSGFGELLGTITAAGQEAFGANARLQRPLRRLSNELWKFVRNNEEQAALREPLLSEDCEGAEGCHSDLAGVAPGDEAAGGTEQVLGWARQADLDGEQWSGTAVQRLSQVGRGIWNKFVNGQEPSQTEGSNPEPSQCEEDGLEACQAEKGSG